MIPIYCDGLFFRFDPINAIYRGIMEAIAILYLAINGAVVMPKDYLDGLMNEFTRILIAMWLIGPSR